MNIDPRHLSLVLAVTRHGSFNRAAEALGISQPALSKSIALLERRIGARVFERGAHGSTLTAVGRVMALRGENLEHLLSRVGDDVLKATRNETGSLVIGATPSTMLGLVPEAVIRLLEVFPSIKVTIIEDLDDRLAPRLQKGEIDVLVGPIQRLDGTESSTTETLVAEDRFFVMLPRGHPKAKAASLSVAELRDERWLLPNPGSTFFRAVESVFITAGVPWPQNSVSSNSLLIHSRMVNAAGFVGIATSAQLIDRDPSISIVPLSGMQPRALGIRRIAGYRHPPMIRAFEECLSGAATALELSPSAPR